MAQPQPQFTKLIDELGHLLQTLGHFWDRSDPMRAFQIRRFEKEARDAGRIDEGMGLYANALIHAIVGEFDLCRGYIQKLEAAGRQEIARHLDFSTAKHFGFFGLARRVYLDFATNIPANLNFFSNTVFSAVFVGEFDLIPKIVQHLQAHSLIGTERAALFMEAAINASFIANSYGLVAEDIVRVLDIAGELMRENKLVARYNELPCFDAVNVPFPNGEEVSEDDPGPPVMLYQFPIDVDEVDAVSLTDAMIGRLIELDIRRDGIVFSFVSHLE